MTLSKLKNIYVNKKHKHCINLASDLIFLFKERGEYPDPSKIIQIAKSSFFFRSTINRLALNEANRIYRYASTYKKIVKLISKCETSTRVSSEDIFDIIKDIDGYPSDLQAVYYQLRVVFENLLGHELAEKYLKSILLSIGNFITLKEH